MQIERKGAGPWADVSVEGVLVTISVSDESRQFDCAALQQDMQLTIDLVMGLDGRLCETAANGGEYVANLIIPPKRYADVPLAVCAATDGGEPRSGSEAETTLSASDSECATGSGAERHLADTQSITPPPVVETVAVPLEAEDMEAVRLILWTIRNNEDACFTA